MDKQAKEIILEFVDRDCCSIINDYVKSMFEHDRQVNDLKRLSKTWINEAYMEEPFFLFESVKYVYQCKDCLKNVKCYYRRDNLCYSCAH